MIDTDSNVLTRVIMALLENPLIKRAQLEVGVEQGTVTLWGEVLSESARLAAEEAARQQAHVLDVVNRLQVVVDYPETGLAQRLG